MGGEETMTRSLIHPDMLGALADFYPASCAIQVGTPTVDSAGGTTYTWANLAAHTAIPCHVAPAGGGEVKGPGYTTVNYSHTIALAGGYSLITANMRAVVGSATYDVIAVENDSLGTTTRLRVQLVSGP
jgi:hypothetical protein